MSHRPNPLSARRNPPIIHVEMPPDLHLSTESTLSTTYILCTETGDTRARLSWAQKVDSVDTACSDPVSRWIQSGFWWIPVDISAGVYAVQGHNLAWIPTLAPPRTGSIAGVENTNEIV